MEVKKIYPDKTNAWNPLHLVLIAIFLYFSYDNLLQGDFLYGTIPLALAVGWIIYDLLEIFTPFAVISSGKVIFYPYQPFSRNRLELSEVLKVKQEKMQKITIHLSNDSSITLSLVDLAKEDRKYIYKLLRGESD